MSKVKTYDDPFAKLNKAIDLRLAKEKAEQEKLNSQQPTEETKPKTRELWDQVSPSNAELDSLIKEMPKSQTVKSEVLSPLPVETKESTESYKPVRNFDFFQGQGDITEYGSVNPYTNNLAKGYDKWGQKIQPPISDKPAGALVGAMPPENLDIPATEPQELTPEDQIKQGLSFSTGLSDINIPGFAPPKPTEVGQKVTQNILTTPESRAKQQKEYDEWKKQSDDFEKKLLNYSTQFIEDKRRLNPNIRDWSDDEIRTAYRYSMIDKFKKDVGSGGVPQKYSQGLSGLLGIQDFFTTQTPKAIDGFLGILNGIGLTGKLTRAEEGPRQQLQSWFKAGEENRKQFKAQDDTWYGLGNGIASVAPAYLTGGLAMLANGGKLATMLSTLSTTAVLEGGLAYNDALEYTKDPRMATQTGLLVALVNAPLETAPILRVFDKFGVDAPAVKKELSKVLIKKNLLKTIPIEMIEQGGVEFWTEGAQELTPLVMESIYKNAKDKPKLAEWIDRIGQSMIYGGLVGMFAGGSGQVVSDVKNNMQYDLESKKEDTILDAENARNPFMTDQELGGTVLDMTTLDKNLTPFGLEPKRVELPAEELPPARPPDIAPISAADQKELDLQKGFENFQNPNKKTEPEKPKEETAPSKEIFSKNLIQERINEVSKEIAKAEQQKNPELVAELKTEKAKWERELEIPEMLPIKDEEIKKGIEKQKRREEIELNKQKNLEKKKEVPTEKTPEEIADIQKQKKLDKDNADTFSDLNRKFQNTKRKGQLFDERIVAEANKLPKDEKWNQRFEKLYQEALDHNKKVKLKFEEDKKAEQEAASQKLFEKPIDKLTPQQKQILDNQKSKLTEPAIATPKVKNLEVKPPPPTDLGEAPTPVTEPTPKPPKPVTPVIKEEKIVKDEKSDGYKQLLEETKIHKEKTKKLSEEINTKINESGGYEFTNSQGITHTLTKDSRDNKKWKLAYFDEKGAIGDRVHNTLEEAIDDFVTTSGILNKSENKNPEGPKSVESKFEVGEKVIFTNKDGKKYEVNFRGYDGDKKAVIVGKPSDKIDQMTVDVSQLSKKPSPLISNEEAIDKAYTKEKYPYLSDEEIHILKDTTKGNVDRKIAQKVFDKIKIVDKLKSESYKGEKGSKKDFLDKKLSEGYVLEKRNGKSVLAKGKDDILSLRPEEAEYIKIVSKQEIVKPKDQRQQAFELFDKGKKDIEVANAVFGDKHKKADMDQVRIWKDEFKRKNRKPKIPKPKRPPQSFKEALYDFLQSNGKINITKDFPTKSLNAMGITNFQLSKNGEGVDPEFMFETIAPGLWEAYTKGKGEVPSQSEMFEELMLEASSAEERIKALAEMRGEVSTLPKDFDEEAYKALDEIIYNEYINSDGDLDINRIQDDIADIAERAKVDEDFINEYLISKDKFEVDPTQFDDVFGEENKEEEDVRGTKKTNNGEAKEPTSGQEEGSQEEDSGNISKEPENKEDLGEKPNKPIDDDKKNEALERLKNKFNKPPDGRVQSDKAKFDDGLYSIDDEEGGSITPDIPIEELKDLVTVGAYIFQDNTNNKFKWKTEMANLLPGIEDWKLNKVYYIVQERYGKQIENIAEIEAGGPTANITGPNLSGISSGTGSKSGERPGIIVVNGENIPKPNSYVSPNRYNGWPDETQILAADLALTQYFDRGGKAFLLADGTGVGKTGTILLTAKEYLNKTGKPVLIITTSEPVVDNNFADDALSMGIDMRKDFFMATYDNLVNNKIPDQKWGLVVFDESQKLKNLTSQRSQMALGIDAEHRLYVSATPTDKPTGATYFFHEITGRTEEDIAAELGYEIVYEWDATEQTEVKKIYLLEGFSWEKVIDNIVKFRDEAIKNGAMIRREYPFYGEVKFYNTNLDDEFARVQDEVYWWYQDKMDRSTRMGKANWSKQRTNDLVRFTESKKVDKIYELMQKDLADGKTVIIFAGFEKDTFVKGSGEEIGYFVKSGKPYPKHSFEAFLGKFAKKLEKDGIKFAKLYGPNQKRKANEVRKFQAGDYKVALATAKSAGAGVNLDDQVGNRPTVLYMASLDFAGDVYEQAIGRVSRRNTKSPAQIKAILSLNAVADNKTYNALKKKMQTLRRIQSGEDPDIAIGIDIASDLGGAMGGGSIQSNRTKFDVNETLKPYDDPIKVANKEVEGIEPAGQINSTTFKHFFGDWKNDPKNASKVVNEKGEPLIVYSGHSNTVMYGENYDPKKGIAGGFYASEDPDIASNYATGKNGGPDLEFENGSQYRLKGKNGKFNKKLWQIEFTPEQKAKLEELKNLKNEYDEYEYDLHNMEIWAKHNKDYEPLARRIMSQGFTLQNIYEYNEWMGNNIAYAQEGDNYITPFFLRQRKNETEQLLDDLGLEWQSHDWSQPGVFPLYLNIRNPLDANKPFPKDLLQALKEAAKGERSVAESRSYRKDYPLKEWINQIETGDEYWSAQVPKKALPILEKFGYDGIKEFGGKGSAAEQQINWIAFRPEQIKSAIANRGTFDPNERSMLKSETSKLDTNDNELNRLKKYKTHLELAMPTLEKEYQKFWEEDGGGILNLINKLDYSRHQLINKFRDKLEKNGDAPGMRLVDAKHELYKTSQALKDLQNELREKPVKGQTDMFGPDPDIPEAEVEKPKPVKIDTKKNQISLFSDKSRIDRSYNDLTLIFGNQEQSTKERISKELLKYQPEFEPGVGIPKRLIPLEWKKTGQISYVGHQLSRNWNERITEIADLHYIFRDPKVETLYLVGVDINGKIVAHAAYTSNASNYIHIEYGRLKELAKDFKRLGVNSVYHLHNHPNGNPLPSGADLENSIFIDTVFKGEGIILESEVVINGDRFMHFKPATQEASDFDKDYLTVIETDRGKYYTTVTQEKYRNPKEHPNSEWYKAFDNSKDRFLLQRPTDVVKLFSKLKYGDGMAALVVTDDSLKIRGYEYFPVKLLEDDAAFQAYFEKQLNSIGGSSFFIVGSQKDLGMTNVENSRAYHHPGESPLVYKKFDRKTIGSKYSHSPFNAVVAYGDNPDKAIVVMNYQNDVNYADKSAIRSMSESDKMDTNESPTNSDNLERMYKAIYPGKQDLLSPKQKEDAIQHGAVGQSEMNINKMAEQRNVTGTAQPFNINERVKEILKHFGVPINEKHLSRKYLGVYKYQTEAVRVQRIYDIVTVTHEVVHALDDKHGITDNLIANTTNGDPIRKGLTDIYEALYPTGDRTHPLDKRMKEGLATLFEYYFYDPAGITGRYRNLVDNFINPRGRFYHSDFTVLLDKMNALVDDYARLEPWQQISARVEYGPHVTKNKDMGFGSYDDSGSRIRNFINAGVNRTKFELFNIFEILERSAKYTDTRRTWEDPSVSAFNYLNRTTLVTNWLNGDAAPVLKRDGNWDFRKETVDQYLKLTKGKEKEFNAYLIARRDLELHNEIERIKAANQDLFAELAEASRTNNFAALRRLFNNPAIQAVKELANIIKNDGFTLQQMTATVGSFETQFAEATRIFDKINMNLVDFSENTGLISPETANLYRSRKGYASFQRYVNDELLTPFNRPGSNSQRNLKSTKKRTGGKLNIKPPTYNQVVAINETIGKGLKNMIWVKQLDLARKDRTIGRRFEVITTETALDTRGRIIFPQENDTNLMKILYNGKRIFVRPAPEFALLNEALKPSELDLFATLLRIPSQVFTRLTTSANPLFALTNVTIDQVTLGYNTHHGTIPAFSPIANSGALKDHFADWLRNVKGDSKMKAEGLNEYLLLGGKRQTFASEYDLAPELLLKAITKDESLKAQVLKVIDSSIGFLEIPSNFSEYASRYAEYANALKNGLSMSEAMYAAAQATLAFQQYGRMGGRVGRAVVKSIPYFNPGMQAVYRYGKAAKDNPVRFTTISAGLLTMALTSAIGVMVSGDDDDKKLLGNIAPEELARALYFPNPVGKGLIRIRIPEQIGAVTGLAYLYVIQHYKGNEATFQDYLRTASSFVPRQFNFSQPDELIYAWTPQLIKPAHEIIANKRTFPELMPIVPEWMENQYKSENQYNDYTSYFAKKLGNAFGLSPMKIDFFVKEQFGVVGNLLMGFGDFTQGDYDRFMRSNPILKTENVFQMMGRAYNHFYDRKELYAKTYNELKGEHSYSDEEADRIKEYNKIYTNMTRELTNARVQIKEEKLDKDTRILIWETLLLLEQDKLEEAKNNIELLDYVLPDKERREAKYQSGETMDERKKSTGRSRNMSRGRNNNLDDIFP